MKLIFTRNNSIKGALIYASGDTIASLILSNFSWQRLAGMVLIGAFLYAFEIPNYFRWIENKTNETSGLKKTLFKTGLAMLYFNPIWIARHLLLINLVSFNFSDISWDLLRISFYSFLVNVPISMIANFLIQNKIKLKWRFIASAVFSAVMAIYYALSMVFF